MRCKADTFLAVAPGSQARIQIWGPEAVVFNPESADTHLLSLPAARLLQALQGRIFSYEELSAAFAAENEGELTAEEADKYLEESIERRLQMFRDGGGDLRQYAAYINVGGGAASVGGSQGNQQLGHGLVLPSHGRSIDEPIDSVATSFLRRGVPVVNMINVVSMANEHGLPIAPTECCAVGDGAIYQGHRLRRSLAVAGILGILMSTTILLRPPTWFSRRWERWGPKGKVASLTPRWMV